MIYFKDFIYYEGTNDPVVNAEITVYDANTTNLSTLYADAAGTVSLSNPIQSDVDGGFLFYAAAGEYDIYYLGEWKYRINLSGGTIAYETGSWTPVDESGAGLSITGANCTYTKIGDMIFLRGTLTFPATADASSCTVGGLPENPAFSDQPGVTTTPSLNYGGVRASSGSVVRFYNVPGNVPRTNASLSGATIGINICYKV